MMGFLFNSTPNQPPTVPTDEVVPLRSWDTALSMRATVLDVTLRFDDVLDVPTLRNALEQLVAIGDWRDLGARLRMNKDGNLEYHVPAHYDASRPAFIFTDTRYDLNINDHGLASKLPRATEKPATVVSPDEFIPLVRGPDTPRKLEDFIYSDQPQLFIHVASFNDATIVTVTWPHTLSDVMGIGAFFNAWTALLRGDREAVLAMQGFRNDPLGELSHRTPPEKYIHYDRVMSKKDVLLFAGRNILNRLYHRQDERRTICVPAAYLQELHRESRAEASACAPNEDPSPFISESDVLLSWWIRTVCYALDLGGDQTILVNNVLNLRTSLHESLVSDRTTYIGNALCLCPALLPGSEILGESVGEIALRIRQSVLRQRTTEQVEAMTALQKQMMEKTGYLALVGDPWMHLLSCSNWHKARLFAMDFSPAVTETGQPPLAQRANGRGVPSYVNGIQHASISFRNVLSVLGKDAAGNWWLTGVLRTDAWDHVEKSLESMCSGDKETGNSGKESSRGVSRDDTAPGWYQLLGQLIGMKSTK